MSRRRLVFSILVLAASALRPAAGQNPSGAALLLPPRLIAGQPATLAVLDAGGKLAAGSVVEFSGGEQVTTDVTGRALFTAPAEAGVLLAHLAKSDVSASAMVVAPPETAASGVRLAELPRLAALNDRLVVSGTGLRGEADANRVRLGGKPAAVLAASPLALVIVPGPGTAPGPTQVEVEIGGAAAAAPTTLVAFELSSPNPAMAQRQSEPLTVRVRGTELPVEFEVRNLAPEKVHLAGGDRQRLTTQGGPDNHASVEIQGRRTGEYSISVRLIPPAAGMPDIAASRQYLLAARLKAPRGWGPRIDNLIERLERHPEDSDKVRDKLEKMLAEMPPGDFGRLLEAAWRVLLAR